MDIPGLVAAIGRSLAERGPRLWRQHRRMIAGGGLVFGLGVLVGLAGGHFLGPRPPSPKPPVAATQLAPPDSDAPATETSQHTVVEDEPRPTLHPSVPPEVASLPPPTPLPAPPAEPAWQRYAVAAPDTGGRPMIAVIIDDMGVDKRRSERVLQLPGPLTVSLMSYADGLGRLSEEARGRGHELMMHVPMEPMGEGIDPGPGALLEALPAEELRKRVDDDLDRFHGFVGINNHMGSKFTAYAPGMQVVMEELRQRGLLFIDSLTTDHSVGLDLARRSGVPTAARNVFLDNQADIAAVNAQLAKVEELARKKGNVIAIGHPRDGTIAALGAWLPTLAAKGLVLVPVTTVVRTRTAVAATAVPASAH